MDATNQKNQLYAGYSEAIITPPMGMGIPGYYGLRTADGVITDLYLRCIAFSNGDQKAVFFCCDCISFRNKGYLLLRKMIAERCGIEETSVYISCTHSHTAFRLVAPDQTDCDVASYRIYIERLLLQFCDCAQLAFEDLKPATVRAALGEAKGVGFCRRYRLKNGTVKTNPKLGDPNVERFESEHDDSLQLIRVLREGAKEILLVNFGTHADVIGGNKYCADYSGYMISYLKGALQDTANVIFFNGCEGDSNHRNGFLPVGTPMKGVPVSQRMGRILAGEVLKIYDDAKEVSGTDIVFKTKTVHIGKNTFDPADLPEAEEIYKIYLEKGSAAPELKDPKFKLNFSAAVRIMETKDLPEFYEMIISGIRIGNFAFIGIPGEPFQQIGKDIKSASSYFPTFVTSCTNGGEENAYYPSADAYLVEGYEKNASVFAPNCAEIITNGALDLLRELGN